ncbi:type II toxin-antitoxin system VapC family toxin [Promineifilum sp.]|uniref:type II toxin-antitoxin system VapC family toxin n=1 Tax=Promineifilum sp. TaxID=2664178 RepID=UPI0035B16B9E
MILDSSAVVALFIKEPGYEELIQRLTEAKTIGIGAPTLVESAIELSARMKRDARGQLARFIEERHVTVIPLLKRTTAQQSRPG